MRKLPREYWYVIAIVIAIFVVFSLAVVADHFKETNCVAAWAFTFFTEWAMVLSASATVLLAVAAFWAILDNRHAKRLDKKERQLNEIAQWSANAQKYCASLGIGFSTPMERIQAAETYFTLKFDGKKLLVAIEKETLDDNLQRLLKNAVGLFDGKSWSSLVDDKDKRQQLETDCENLMTTAFELLGK